MNNQFRNMNVNRERGNNRGGVNSQGGYNNGSANNRGSVNQGKFVATNGADQDTRVMINMCKIRVTKNIPFFKYDIKINLKFPTGQEKELTTDKFRPSRRNCAIILAYVATNDSEVDLTAYNGAACLYSLSKFEEKIFTFDGSEVNNLSEYKDTRITVTIKPTTENFQASTNDLKSCLNSSPEYQPNLLEVLNILLDSQAVAKPDQWLSFEGIHYLIANNEKTKNIGAGVILKPGLKTAADVVGDDEKNLQLIVVADIKTMVLHIPMTVAQKLDALKAAHCYNYADCLNGITVVPIYGEKRIPFQIAGVNSKIMISSLIDGQKINNIEYFRSVYQINLTRVELPMIGKKTRERMIWYPAEVLQILPNQSVQKEQMLQCHHETIVTYSAMVPEVRVNLCYEYMRNIGLFDSQTLKKYGFEVEQDFLQLKCTILSAVRVNGSQPRSNTTVNLKVPFHKPPTITNWAIANLGIDNNIFNDFKDWLVDVLRNKGVTLTDPINVPNSCNMTAEYLLQKCQANRCPFIVIVLGENNDARDSIKYFEMKYQVVTQIMKGSVVKKVVQKNQGMTMENVVLKTCLKNRGIPYGVETEKGVLKIRTNDVLYIGVCFSHQQKGGGFGKFKKLPSRVGYAATCSVHPNQVIGDFRYVEPHNNEACLQEVAKIVGECKDRFKQNRSVFPKNIVLYLSGYSDGQYKLLLDQFVPKIKQLLSGIKLILLLESKTTMERLYRPELRDGLPRDVNIQAGVCLDHTILNPLFKGFYLNPHIVLQGTARTAKYTVLVNEPNIDLRSIEYATHALCFLHSLCQTPTAEPAVLTIADACALRGQSVLKFHMRHMNLEGISVDEANRDLTNPEEGRVHSLRYNA